MAKSELHDCQMGGRRFTRFNKEGSKMSKLDRFLVSHNFFNVWENANVTALSRSVSDHSPILLKVGSKDFGAKCLRVFDHWIDSNGFNEVIEKTWLSCQYRGSTDIVLKNKLKKLKQDIKIWSRAHSDENNKRKSDLYDRLLDWDSKAEAGILSSFERDKREEIFRL